MDKHTNTETNTTSLNPWHFDINDVIDDCDNLSQLRKRKLKKEHDHTVADYGPFGNNMQGRALSIWVEDTFEALPFPGEIKQLIISEFYDEITQFGFKLWLDIASNTLGKHVKDKIKLPVKYIGIGDRRYVAFTGMSEMLDVTTGDFVSGVKIQFLETIQYNLTALFMRRYLRLKHKRSYDVSNSPPTTNPKQ